MASKKKKLSPEQELKKNARRYKGKRITKQVRIERGRYKKVRAIAKEENRTLSSQMDAVIDRYSPIHRSPKNRQKVV